MDLTWLKDMLLKFAIDRVNEIAVGLVKLLIEAINDGRTDEVLNQIKNPVHRQIAKMVLDIIEEVLKTVQTAQPILTQDNIEKVVLDTGTEIKVN